tara:strand:- start:1569 stop:2216 length:648 start_codon:yes stop_codon:yes gene_type:complete
MQYRIIITSNGKKKKIVHESEHLSSIKRKYFSLKDKNVVLCPKKTSAYLKTKPIEYEIILMKKWEENDLPFVGRDEMGRTIEIEDKNKKWTILHKAPYYYEEKFTVFGFKTRLTSIEIIKSILLRKHTSIIVKQVNYIENKLLIHQDNDFDVVLCKCPADAKRLFETLREFINHNGIKHIMFTGKINLGKTDTYKMIIEKTGWKKEKIYRRVTRP